MSDLMNAIIAAKLMGNGGGGGGLPPIISEATVIIEKQTLPFEDVGGGTYEWLDPSITTPIVAGVEYIVNWDNTDYTCVAYDYQGMAMIGNASIAGGADTGEPFLVVVIPDVGLAVDTSNTAPSHIVGLKTSGAQTPPDGYVLMVVDGEWKAAPLP